MIPALKSDWDFQEAAGLHILPVFQTLIATMGKTSKRGHEEVDTYEEDDFVENDDGSARKGKKSKKAQASSEDENKFWEVSLNEGQGHNAI